MKNNSKAAKDNFNIITRLERIKLELIKIKKEKDSENDPKKDPSNTDPMDIGE